MQSFLSIHEELVPELPADAKIAFKYFIENSVALV